MEKLKEFEDKAQEHQAKMESELVQWKNKYLTRTNALKQELEEVKRLRFTDKETLEKQLQEAVKSKVGRVLVYIHTHIYTYIHAYILIYGSNFDNHSDS